MSRIAVFCGSSPGTDPELPSLAHEVGAELARRGIGVVYGAGGKGLMGAVADGALAAGGEVIGVIPQFMIDREWGRDDLTELHVVDTMHQRKALMAELSDAILCLPGGLGTLEEIFEVWSWRTLGLNDDPIGFLDHDGFWTPMLEAVRGLADAGFMAQATIDDLVVGSDLAAVLDGLESRRR